MTDFYTALFTVPVKDFPSVLGSSLLQKLPLKYAKI
jgi:hypothetical protein